MTSEPTGRNRQPFWVVLPWILLGVVAVLWGVRAGGPSVSAKKPPLPKADGVLSTPPAAPAAPALPSASTTDTAAPEPPAYMPPAYMPPAGVEAAEGVRDWVNGMARRVEGAASRASDALGGTAAGTPAGTRDYGTSTTPDYGTDSNTDYGTKPGAGTTAADVYAPDAGTTTDDGGAASDEDYGTGTPDTTIARVPREVAYAFHRFDGLERGNAWAVESAADHAVLRLTAERTTEGKQALQADFEARGKGKFELRREVKLDLTDATAFLVDVHNAGEPLDLTLALRGGTDAALFTSPSKPILNGWNRNVAFALEQMTADGGDAYTTSWRWSRDAVTRVSLIFGERGQATGTVVVDNLRFDRAAADIGHLTQPVLKKVTASAPSVERFATLELDLEFDADYQDYFDRTQVDVVAAFTAPSGKRSDVHGFVFDTDAAAGQPQWRVRFTPTETGRWRYDVTVKTAGGQEVSGIYAFHCTRKADRRGFIRIAASDPRYFEFDDGSFYYPIGQNVCWASKYDYFLGKIQHYGGNYVRVWLCPWNLQLEDPTEPGKYDLRVARQLDELLGLCEQRGITLQLVLRYHGMHGENWPKNPYNTVNGGPCYAAGDFFTDATAKALHKQFLDYVVARWGHSPALFAWELWNEADLARADSEASLVAWHREMADYLKKIDAHGHLVTTSVATPGRHTALFEHRNIDFVPVHFYAPDIPKKVHESLALYRKLRKPIFIGEFSGGHRPADDLADAKGVRVHAGLWLAFTAPLAGSAMPWWWDTYVDKNELYPHWAALTAFAKGVDRRGRNHELVRSSVKLGDTAQASLQGIVAPSEAYLWVHDARRIAPADQAERPLLIEPRPVTLAGMLGGSFRVEIWDTYAGKVVQTLTATTATDGTLTFALPPCDRDVAVKVVKEAAGPNGGRPRVAW